MCKALDNTAIPLSVRMALADAALAYANAMVEHGVTDITDVPTSYRDALMLAAEDAYVCQRAIDLGMVEGNE